MRGILLTILLLAAVSAQAGEVIVKSNDFTSSKVCAHCHKNIFNTWQNSLHSSSLTDPIFRASYLEAYHETQGRASQVCMPCHAPLVNVNKDFDLLKDITREGVSCDFCHSVKDVQLSASGPNKFVLEPGLVKRASIVNTSSPSHQVAFSKLHKSALLCAGCHEYKNSLGAPVFTTYSEWKASSYAKDDKPCQSCHMEVQEGSTVAPGVSPTAQTTFNVHTIAGGHSVEQLKKSVEVEIAEVRRVGDKMSARVIVTNVGAGHMVPTGIPTRRLLLKLTAKGQNAVLYETERVYEKVLVDKDGRVLTKDWEIMLHSKKVIKDTRLKPNEPRAEIFNLNLPKNSDPVVVSASLFYDYRPQVVEETPMSMELKSVKKAVPAAQ
ncbi:MAG: hypothetical protein A3F89_03855 [Deltaproteobacteria bacterium RIFCSPLOWO2_12_FULL_50_11]|nr:MAG: hypothetical protein A3B79_00540 [Deltaproteobacteria bacterium RIFCSPHIGHO2_02_FULL_50_15]OGQ66554.1 MAG: hypothetical protein A3F89_03855 [Deltaproteobacteria bacterium RIFCSPLOWO2_12_FULL_50_11]